MPFVAVTAMRARFFFSPMTTDEGGYLAVARAWFHGADLYGKVWVDRPQGLLVVYGVLDRVASATPSASGCWPSLRACWECSPAVTSRGPLSVRERGCP